MGISDLQRRRLLGLGAAGLFWGGLLAALGFGVAAVVVTCACLLAPVAAWVWGAVDRSAARLWLEHSRLRRSRLVARSVGMGGRETRALLRRSREFVRRGTTRVRLERARRAARRRAAERRKEAWALSHRGARLRQGGRLDEAIRCCESALALFRALGDRRGVALTLNSLGLALARNGEPGRAIGCYEDALHTLHALGEGHGEGRVMANLGSAHGAAGRQEQALEYWRAALQRLDPASPEHDRMAEQLQLTG